MANRGDVVVSIGAEAQLAPGLADAKRQVDGFARDAGARLKAFAREQRSEARTAGFFVQELSAIVPMSGNVKTALGGIGAAIVGGAGLATGLGLLAAGAGLLITHFRENAEAARKTAEEIRKLTEDTRQAIVALDVLKAKRAGDAVGAALASGEGAIVGASAAVAAAQRALDTYKREQGLLLNSKGAVIQATEQQFAEIDRLTQAIALAETNLARATVSAQMERTAVYEAQGATRTAAAKREHDALNKLAEATKRARQYEIDAANRDFELRYLRGEEDEQRAIDAANREFELRYEREQEALERLTAQTREYVSVGVDGFFAIGRAAFQGADAARAAWDSMLNAFLSIVQRMVTEWVTAQLTMAAVNVATSGAGAAVGGGVSMPELLPMGKMTVPGVSGKLAPAAALAKGGSEVNLYVQTLDASSFGAYLSKNKGVLAGQISALTYEGRI